MAVGWSLCLLTAGINIRRPFQTAPSHFFAPFGMKKIVGTAFGNEIKAVYLSVITDIRTSLILNIGMLHLSYQTKTGIRRNGGSKVCLLDSTVCANTKIRRYEGCVMQKKPRVGSVQSDSTNVL